MVVTPERLNSRQSADNGVLFGHMLETAQAYVMVLASRPSGIMATARREREQASMGDSPVICRATNQVAMWR
jgi:hypothetical protein